MFKTNLTITTQTPNPALATNGVAFSMLSNEKGFLALNPETTLHMSLI